MSDEEKVICHTPTPGKQATRIHKWKYDVISASIIRILKSRSKEGVLFQDLSGLVEADIGKKMASEIGSMRWYTTNVKLDMECKGIIYRISSVSPQRLVLK